MEFGQMLADGTLMKVSVGEHALGSRDNLRVIFTGAESKPCADKDVVLEGAEAIQQTIAILQRMVSSPLRQVS